MLKTAKSQRSDTNTAINYGETPPDHHITKKCATLVTWDSKIIDLYCICSVLFCFIFLSFLGDLVVRNTSILHAPSYPAEKHHGHGVSTPMLSIPLFPGLVVISK